jgi:hypothetical protein
MRESEKRSRSIEHVLKNLSNSLILSCGIEKNRFNSFEEEDDTNGWLNSQSF